MNEFLPYRDVREGPPIKSPYVRTSLEIWRKNRIDPSDMQWYTDIHLHDIQTLVFKDNGEDNSEWTTQDSLILLAESEWLRRLPPDSLAALTKDDPDTARTVAFPDTLVARQGKPLAEDAMEEVQAAAAHWKEQLDVYEQSLDNPETMDEQQRRELALDIFEELDRMELAVCAAERLGHTNKRAMQAVEECHTLFRSAPEYFTGVHYQIQIAGLLIDPQINERDARLARTAEKFSAVLEAEEIIETGGSRQHKKRMRDGFWKMAHKIHAKQEIARTLEIIPHRYDSAMLNAHFSVSQALRTMDRQDALIGSDPSPKLPRHFQNLVHQQTQEHIAASRLLRILSTRFKGQEVISLGNPDVRSAVEKLCEETRRNAGSLGLVEEEKPPFPSGQETETSLQDHLIKEQAKAFVAALPDDELDPLEDVCSQEDAAVTEDTAHVLTQQEEEEVNRQAQRFNELTEDLLWQTGYHHEQGASDPLQGRNVHHVIQYVIWRLNDLLGW